jgi:hypothetical protein
MGQTVERFDFTRLDAARVKQTSHGFLTVAGRLTRVGVLDYYRADGSLYRELRHPEDVFDAASLASLAMSPMTKLHGGMVNPDNVQALQVGIVGHDVQGRLDGPYVTGSATVQRGDAIKGVLAKDLTELSPGYRCEVQDGAGTWDGSAFGLGQQKFDGRQRHIDYNHLAIGPKNWGRSGRNVALHMDSLESGAAFARCDHAGGMGGFIRDRLSLLNRTQAELAAALGVELIEFGMILDGFITPSASVLEKLSGLIDVPVEKLEGMIPASEKGEAFVSRKRDSGDPADTTRGQTPMKTITIVMDDISYQVEIADALATTFATSHEKMRADAAELPEVKGKLLVAEKSADDYKVKLDAATDPAALAVAIAARTQVVQDAKKIAPKLEIDERADDNTIKIAALVASGYKAEDFEHEDSRFVDGVFLAASKSAPAAPTAPVMAPGPVMRSDSLETPLTPEQLKTPIRAADCTAEHSDAAQARMIARNRDASAGDLDMTKAAAQKR